MISFSANLMGMEFVYNDILDKCRTLYGVDRFPPVNAILLNKFVAAVFPCRDIPNKRILAAIVEEKSGKLYIYSIGVFYPTGIVAL